MTIKTYEGSTFGCISPTPTWTFGDRVRTVTTFPSTAKDVRPRVEVLVGRNAAVAVITFEGLTFSGESKRNKGEKYDYQVARNIAIGRAFSALGKHLVKEADKRLNSLTS